MGVGATPWHTSIKPTKLIHENALFTASGPHISSQQLKSTGSRIYTSGRCMALLPGYRPCSTSWCPAARATTGKARRSKQPTVASAAGTDAGRLFVFGLGYTGLGLVRHLQRQGGWRCVGTCRTPEKAATLAQSGVGAHVYDPDNLHFLGSDALQDLSASTHILFTIAPNADFDRDPVRSKAHLLLYTRIA